MKRDQLQFSKRAAGNREAQITTAELDAGAIRRKDHQYRHV